MRRDSYFAQKTLTMLIYGTSALLFAAGMSQNRVFLVFAGMPFYLLLLVSFHELGHVLGCLINKNRITGFCIPLLTIREKKLSINSHPLTKSYCAFITSDCDAAVYLFGPIFSVLAALIAIIAFLCEAGHYGRAICALGAVVHAVNNCCPFPESDIRRLKKEIARRRRTK